MTADFRVLAPTVELHGKVAQIMDDLLPQIAAAFGNPVGETVFVAVAPDCQSAQLKSGAISGSGGILLYDTDPSRIVGNLGHEIVHVVVGDRPSCWNRLPVVLEEGLCCLVDYGLEGTDKVVLEGYMPTPVVEHYLGLSQRDLHSQEGDEIRATYRSATYMAGLLGFQRLEALCRRACGEGHALIPTEWILAALEEVEILRHSKDPAAPSSSVDPLFGRIEASVPRKTTITIRADFPGHEFEEVRQESTTR